MECGLAVSPPACGSSVGVLQAWAALVQGRRAVPGWRQWRQRPSQPAGLRPQLTCRAALPLPLQVQGLDDEVEPALVPFALMINHSPRPHIVRFSRLDAATNQLRCAASCQGGGGATPWAWCRLRLQEASTGVRLPHLEGRPCEALLARHADPGPALLLPPLRRLCTFRRTSAGEELCLSYGALPNSHLLLFYGFALEANPAEAIELNFEVRARLGAAGARCACSPRPADRQLACTAAGGWQGPPPPRGHGCS
jgi:hypothetical protein